MPETVPEQFAPSIPLNTGLTASFSQPLQATLRKINLADLMLLLYATAFVRQYLWIVSNNTIAWIVTVMFSLALWYLHLATKPVESDTTPVPRPFWLVVALPLLAIYGMRAVFPDGSFDQLNYHLLNSERSLRGLPMLPGDFFASPFPFNPSSDIITGITRFLLGYRLGTIANYLAILWSATIVYKLLRGYIGNIALGCAGVLLIVLNEQLLFVINNYMTDALALPLLLESTYLIVINREEHAEDKRRLVRIALFLGAAVALKLTHLSVVVPLLALYVYRLVSARKLKAANATLFIVLFLAPLLPFSIFMYWQTQNPIFPFYNKIFRSPYWPMINWADVRWGPKTFWETLFWPVVVLLRPQRSSELIVHSGRVCVAFIAAILGLALRRVDKNTRLLSGITLIGIALWTLSTGYVRYALYFDVLGGVLVLRLAWYFQSSSVGFTEPLKRVVVGFLWAVLVLQSVLAVKYTSQLEWGMRTTYFYDDQAFFKESEYLLRDRSLVKFLAPRERKLLSNVDVWVESNFTTSGVEALLRKDAPIILVCFPYYFETQASLDKFSKAIADASNKRIYSLVFAKDLGASLDMLYFRGLELGTITPVTIPFYSEYTRFEMILIEVLPPGKGIKRYDIKMTRAEAALPPGGFKAEIVADPDFTLKAGRPTTISVRIKNTSSNTWPALGQTDGRYAIRLGNHWLDESNQMIIQDDNRASLVHDVQPEQEIELPLTITPPATAGRYVLELDMVQELVAWFGTSGSKTFRLNVLVEP